MSLHSDRMNIYNRNVRQSIEERLHLVAVPEGRC